MGITLTEKQVLQALGDGKEQSVHYLAEKAGVSADGVRRIIVELEQKGLVQARREKVVDWVPSVSGKDALQKQSLPEQRLCVSLIKKSASLDDLKQFFDGSSQEFSAAFGLAKRSNWIEVKSGDGKTLVHLSPLGKKSIENSPVWMVLQAISRGEKVSETSNAVIELKARGLIQSKTFTNESARITDAGKKGLQQKTETKNVHILGQLSPQNLVRGDWKQAEFKPYDVNAGVEPRYAGRIHPLRQVLNDVRRIMVEMGFSEMTGPLVESAFWNMDAMFIPQDHPAREIQDTFYLPGKAVLQNMDLVKRVKAIHEHGGKTGSKGFGYEWDPRTAMQLLMRTHTTAATYRSFGEDISVPQKRFAIGRIFRNETIDATHLAEFHQVEGFVMGEGLTLRHLMGVIKEFYAKLGLTKIKFKPTYNPYTEPSMEALAYHPKLEKWIEMVNSGMFRAESLAPFGIKVPVIAWGFGLERLALFVHEKTSLREIMGPDVDLDWIRQYDGTQHTVGGV